MLPGFPAELKGTSGLLSDRFVTLLGRFTRARSKVTTHYLRGVDLVANKMDGDTVNLNDEHYMSVEDMMAENEDDQDADGDSITSPAKTRARESAELIPAKGNTENGRDYLVVVDEQHINPISSPPLLIFPSQNLNRPTSMVEQRPAFKSTSSEGDFLPVTEMKGLSFN
ncbi:hypothetical protein Bca52824_090105 [Brassica carinata]|uniref:Uncharacterized protein n=1 Tax=Brassica carinata TaxID=52824 RepID=A0A8X7NTH6_BRACI|nr:hypothetical protein Bca52824_090105 [Brassica carinata]